MIPKDNEDFAWWIVEKLMDEGLIERSVAFNRYNKIKGLYKDKEIKAAIRRILMENEKEEGDEG
jgi:hypothetical protein